MQIAAWNHPINEPVIRALEEAYPGGVTRCGLVQGIQMLSEGFVDVALLPSDQALAGQETLEILPAVAVSSWGNPWVTLMVGSQLGAATMGIMHAPEGRSAALLAAMVLKEHYQTKVMLHEQAELPEGLANHALVTVPLTEEEQAKAEEERGEAADPELEGFALDLGQEWSEMAGYPFVWSLFACRKDEATPDMITGIRDVITRLDQDRVELERAWDLDEVSSDFFLNHLRLTLDDLALASMTEFCDHLFFYGVTSEVLPVQFASLPRGAGEPEEEPEEEEEDEFDG